MSTSKNNNTGVLVFALLFTIVVPLGLAQSIWDGGGTDSNWTTAANWNNDTAPVSANTTAIQLAGSTQTSINVDTAFTIGSLTVNSGAGAFALSGSELSIASSNGITNNSSNLLTINNDIKLLGTTTIYAYSANIILGGNINLNGQTTFTLKAATNQSLTTNGVISGNSTTTVVYNNASSGGTYYVNGASTYAGPTKIWGGTVVLGNASALSSGVVYLGYSSNPYTQSLVTASALTIANNIILTSTSGSNSNTIGSQNTSGTSVFSGTITMGNANAAAPGLTVTAAGTSRVNFTGGLLRYSGATGSADTLIKTGTGIVALSSTNTYLGATTVSAGTLLVNGTLSSGGAAVTVNSGATLGGYGTINRDVNILSGAYLEVGDNNAGITGVFTVTGNLGFASGSTLKLDLGANSSSSDSIQVNGAVTLGTLTLNLTTSTDFGQSVAYTLLTATSGITGSVSNITLTGSSVSNYTLEIEGNSLVLVSSAIPEPGTAALLAGGVVLLGVLLRRRRA